MATKDTNRVAKDTSARKQPNVLSDAKAEVEAMYPELLLQKTQEGYDKVIEDLVAAHAEEIASLKTQLEKLHKGDEQGLETMKAAHDKEIMSLNAILGRLEEDNARQISELKDAHNREISSLKTPIRQAFEAGGTNARSESDKEIVRLKDSAAGWKDLYQDTREKHEEALEDKDIALAVVKADLYRVQNERNELQAKKNHETANLKRQAALEIIFRVKGGRERSYLRRPGTRFRDAVEELCKHTGRPFCGMRFFTSFDKNKCYNTIGRDWDKTAGIVEIIPGMKTLEELGIKDKDEIWFQRRD